MAHLPVIVIDFETYSELPLKGPKSVGVWRYAEHESTEILCLGYKFPGEPRFIWTPGVPFPQRLIDAARNDTHIFEAHNAQFERAIWIWQLLYKLRIPMPRKWRDTMAACAYKSLPLGLEDVGETVNLATKKDKRGKYLLEKLSKPQRPTKKNPETRCQDLDLLDELYDYCGQDVETECALGDTIGPLTDSEQRIWVLDQTINQRGVMIDIEAVIAARWCVEAVSESLIAEMKGLTGGQAVTYYNEKKDGTIEEKTAELETAKQTKVLQAWFEREGFGMTNLKAETVANALKYYGKTMPPKCRRMLEIRQQLAKASTAKLDKFLMTVSSDGRVRGMLQYHGAGTGRWSGRGVQPQNFPRGNEDMFEALAKGLSKGHRHVMHDIIETIKEAYRQKDYRIIEIHLGDVTDVVASALRGMFISAPGKVFYNADFSAIEGRVTAWVSGEQWKLDAFAAIDRGEGYKGSQDIYLATASMVFGYPCLTKKSHKKERQVGKVCELAFGYMGGANAWRNFDKKQDHEEGYLSDFEVNLRKDDWRKAHPNVVEGWYGLDRAAIAAVENYENNKETPSQTYADGTKVWRAFTYRTIGYQVIEDRAGHWLACRLPNGRLIWYYKPEIGIDTVTRADGSLWKRKHVCYWGTDNKNGNMWTLLRGYGGLWMENVVQAISRDLMVEAMCRLEAAGYRIVLTVHDEVHCEVDEGFGSIDEFNRIMQIVPSWAAGLPIAADPWKDTRYHK
jgi:DNA polymerase